MGPGHQPQGVQQLHEGDAPGFRGPGAREHGRIQAVQVDGEIHRSLALFQIPDQLFQPSETEGMQVRVGMGELPFFPFPAADAELVDFPVPDQVVAPADHTGMAQFRPQVVIPQVRVGIKVDDLEVRVLFQHRPEGAQGHQVFASDHKGQLPVLEDGGSPVLNVLQGHFRTAKAQFQVPAVEHCIVRQILVLIGTVGFQAEAFVADGGRPEPGAGPVAGGGIKGGSEQDDFGLFVRSVAGQEGFHIICQHFCSLLPFPLP
ncbi:unknown [Acidaminococcus sp. CAG:542]|nr:unknown [Acidaminococcus sp. CAG:542]